MSTIVQELRLVSQFTRKWNKKIGAEFGLAPKVVREGRILLSRDECIQYEKEFDLACSEFVEQELRCLVETKGARTLENGVVSIVGPGKGRGLGFAPYADKLGMRIDLLDLSDKALELSEEILTALMADGKFALHHTEVVGMSGEISFDSDVIVMSQFLQVLGRKRKNAIMRSMAKHFMSGLKCLIIVHPFDKDNPDPDWGDTTPYSMKQLLDPLEQSLGKSVSIRRQTTIRYYDLQTYTAFTIVES